MKLNGASLALAGFGFGVLAMIMLVWLTVFVLGRCIAPPGAVCS